MFFFISFVSPRNWLKELPENHIARQDLKRTSPAMRKQLAIWWGQCKDWAKVREKKSHHDRLVISSKNQDNWLNLSGLVLAYDPANLNKDAALEKALKYADDQKKREHKRKERWLAQKQQ